MGGSSFSQALPLSSVIQEAWLEHLPVKTKAKKFKEYLSLPCIPGNQVSRFIQERAHNFLSLPFIANTLTEALLVPLDFPSQIQFSRLQLS